MSNVSLIPATSLRTSQSSTPLQADPLLTQQFQDAMNQPAADEATDEELASLSDVDLAGLRTQSGGDDHAFRRAAKELLQIQDTIVSGVVQNGIKEVFKRAAAKRKDEE